MYVASLFFYLTQTNIASFTAANKLAENIEIFLFFGVCLVEASGIGKDII